MKKFFIVLISVFLLTALMSTSFAEDLEYYDKAKEVVEVNRQKKIIELYAKKINEIENLKARIKKLKEEIEEIEPDTIQVELDENWDSELELTFNANTSWLKILSK